MLERFEGKDGKRRLVEVFAEQELVQHNDTIARKLADIAKVEDFQKGKQLYVQGEPGKNCFLSSAEALSCQFRTSVSLS